MGSRRVVAIRHFSDVESGRWDPYPNPPPLPAAGLPASGQSKSDQTPAGRGLVGREHTELAARAINLTEMRL